MRVQKIRAEAVRLRQSGKTYAEIQNILERPIPKSTLSYWCSKTPVPQKAQHRIAALSEQNLARGRKIASEIRQRVRAEKLQLFTARNTPLYALFRDSEHAKMIALAILYLGEGSKGDRSSLMFGNSSPNIVGLFLSLLRSVFTIDERKFRVTVQCRADQDTKVLMAFWSRCTGVPISQFYKTQIDRRTINKPTKNQNYRGVCRIDYFSADVDLELRHIAKELEKM